MHIHRATFLAVILGALSASHGEALAQDDNGVVERLRFALRVHLGESLFVSRNYEPIMLRGASLFVGAWHPPGVHVREERAGIVIAGVDTVVVASFSDLSRIGRFVTSGSIAPDQLPSSCYRILWKTGLLSGYSQVISSPEQIPALYRSSFIPKNGLRLIRTAKYGGSDGSAWGVFFVWDIEPGGSFLGGYVLRVRCDLGPDSLFHVSADTLARGGS